MSKRDNFTQGTNTNLAKRVGYLCSNPDCRVETIGANENPNKSTSVGVGAHITAASVGGPRYDASLSHPERRDAYNGIWLCNKCSTLIDKDPNKYTVEILHEWKSRAEDESRKKLSGEIKTTTANIPYLEADILGWGRIRSPRGYSNLNPVAFEDGRWVMKINLAEQLPIIHWHVVWTYNIVIFNNSTSPAINVRIEDIGEDVRLSFLEILPDVNNIPALDSKTLKIKYDYHIEAVHSVPDDMMKTRFPYTFQDLKLKLTYLDERRNMHQSFITIKDDKVVTEKA